MEDKTMTAISMSGYPNILRFDRFSVGEKADLLPDLKRSEVFDDRIICIHCENTITSQRCGTEVEGSFSHSFVNPAGITYTIGCFSSAVGCRRDAQPTYNHTWFSGYSWQYALCHRCQLHLGWFYTGSKGKFYGLILERLKP